MVALSFNQIVQIQIIQQITQYLKL